MLLLQVGHVLALVAEIVPHGTQLLLEHHIFGLTAIEHLIHVLQLTSLRRYSFLLVRYLGARLESVSLQLYVALLQAFLFGAGLTQVLVDIVQVVLVLLDLLLEHAILKIGILQIILDALYVLLKILYLALELVSRLVSVREFSILRAVVLQLKRGALELALLLLEAAVVLGELFLHAHVLTSQDLELLLLVLRHGSYDLEILLERIVHDCFVIVQLTNGLESVMVVLSMVLVVLRHAHHLIVEVYDTCGPEGLRLARAALG